MNLTVGIYDVASYTIPGSLYVSAAAALSWRLGWWRSNVTSPSLLVISVFVLTSYVVGHLVYGPTKWFLGRLAVICSWKSSEPSSYFTSKNPGLVAEAFVEVNPYLLGEGIRIAHPHCAHEIDRLRAISTMLRNSAPPYAISGLGALLCIIFGSPRALPTALLALVLLVASVLALFASRRVERWANTMTYQYVVWLPDIRKTPFDIKV
jgi:hypothetical protein